MPTQNQLLSTFRGEPKMGGKAASNPWTLHFEDARRLLENVHKDLAIIGQAHDAAFARRCVDDDFKIKLKHLLGDLESVLDYLACGLFLKYGDQANHGIRDISFPCAPLSQSAKQFERQLRRRLGLPKRGCNELVAAIRFCQHYSDRSNRWLPDMMTLVNTSKHQLLSLHMERGMSIGNGAASIVGNGGGVSIRNMTVIKDGVRRTFSLEVEGDLEDARYKGPEGMIEYGLYFDEPMVPVMRFLTRCVAGVSQTVDTLSNL